MEVEPSTYLTRTIHSPGHLVHAVTARLRRVVLIQLEVGVRDVGGWNFGTSAAAACAGAVERAVQVVVRAMRAVVVACRGRLVRSQDVEVVAVVENRVVVVVLVQVFERVDRVCFSQLTVVFHVVVVAENVQVGVEFGVDELLVRLGSVIGTCFVHVFRLVTNNLLALNFRLILFHFGEID